VTSNKLPFALEHFDNLPNSSFVDVKVLAAIHGSAISTVWLRIKRGDPLMPKPRKFGRSTRFSVREIRQRLAKGA
jgi:predicted DNA-binding transcriptional regulator AlpA